MLDKERGLYIAHCEEAVYLAAKPLWIALIEAVGLRGWSHYGLTLPLTVHARLLTA